MDRDMEKKPYTADETRVCEYLRKIKGDQVRCGDDPIGYLMASRSAQVRHLAAERAEVERLEKLTQDVRVGSVIFRKGVSVSTVLKAARRAYEHAEATTVMSTIEKLPTPEGIEAFKAAHTSAHQECESLRAEVARLKALVEGARVVIEPFAEYCGPKNMEPLRDTDRITMGSDLARKQLTVANCRAARAWTEATQEKDK